MSGDLSDISPTLEHIQVLERRMREFPQLEIKTTHTFSDGMYIRTIHVPADATITGQIHATEHIFTLIKGEMTVVTEEGRQHIKAPFQAVCRPGLKRVGHAHTDCVCANVHITDETDLDRLESQLIVPEALCAPEALKEVA